jgi:hypothetical protein
MANWSKIDQHLPLQGPPKLTKNCDFWFESTASGNPGRKTNFLNVNNFFCLFTERFSFQEVRHEELHLEIRVTELCCKAGLPDGKHIFIPKIPVLVYFGVEKCWYVLWPLGIF